MEGNDEFGSLSWAENSAADQTGQPQLHVCSITLMKLPGYDTPIHVPSYMVYHYSSIHSLSFLCDAPPHVIDKLLSHTNVEKSGTSWADEVGLLSNYAIYVYD